MSIKNIIPQKIKNIYHLGQAILANFIYGFPSRHIKIIGVTGTNGKTTTVQMIGKILEEAGFKVAINSTINFQIGARKWVNKTKFTTLSSLAVQKFICEAVKERCDYLVLETSSHSLDQFRVWGISYAVAVITNVTREHLDYHQTMEAYRRAKSRLFKNLKSNFQFSIFNFQSIFNDKNLEKNKKVSIVNLDMENPEDFLNFTADEKYGYTTKNQNANLKNKNDNEKLKIVAAENIEQGINYSSYQLQTINYKLSLPGKFNIENALAATCVGLSQNIDSETIKSALEKIKGIPGRMEYVPNNKGLDIIIDYAVTPDSLEKLYTLIKNINTQSKKVIAVFGACGERDRGKRPIMGRIVAKYADYAIITNEDPYGENEVAIINQVFSGIVGIEVDSEFPNFQFSNPLAMSSLAKPDNLKNPKTKFIEGINCFRILDRREAIGKALALAQAGDFVIVTGKGAEEIMAIGKERIPWKEKEVIKEELAKL